MDRVRISIRRKLLFATLAPLCVAIVLCWFIGAKLITDRVFRQAQQTVIGDLASARNVYQDEIQHLSGIVKVAALSSGMTGSLSPAVMRSLRRSLGCCWRVSSSAS